MTLSQEKTDFKNFLVAIVENHAKIYAKAVLFATG